jgi:hypothetical protein
MTLESFTTPGFKKPPGAAHFPLKARDYIMCGDYSRLPGKSLKHFTV